MSVASAKELPNERCRYCLGGYCKHEDVRLVELRTVPGSRKWDGGTTTAGKKCRIYLRGHIRFAKESTNAT